MAKTKISYSDVISYFEDADLELAGLLFKLIQDKLEARISDRDALSARLTKARAARKGGPRKQRSDAGQPRGPRGPSPDHAMGDEIGASA